MANTPKMDVIMRVLARALASGAGSGYLRPAPGTWGSAAALILLIYWQPASVVLALVLCVSLPAAYWAIARMQSQTQPDHSDPGWIVIDEWQGLALGWLIARPSEPAAYVLLFLAFRFFDARKMGPVREADTALEGPWGVMVDDWLAGVAAGLITLMGLYAWQYAAAI